MQDKTFFCGGECQCYITAQNVCVCGKMSLAHTDTNTSAPTRPTLYLIWLGRLNFTIGVQEPTANWPFNMASSDLLGYRVVTVFFAVNSQLPIRCLDIVYFVPWIVCLSVI